MTAPELRELEPHARGAPEKPLRQWCLATARNNWGPAVHFTSTRTQPR
ncbi:hypothetical protein QF026_000009 [Streptomyces aurantiacus]|nr:hypothetical protein [Streptomyces aurantiacus]MDQ0771543.1 hypothetical protein [Streptomyces aurantiacus]